MDINRFLLPCLNKKLFGIDCLGCGFQRALIQLFEGNLESAFMAFPALYSTLLFLIIVGLHFADESRNYSKLLILTSGLNALIILGAYLYKMSILFF